MRWTLRCYFVSVSSSAADWLLHTINSVVLINIVTRRTCLCNRVNRWTRAWWRKWSWPSRRGRTRTRSSGLNSQTIQRSELVRNAKPVVVFQHGLLWRERLPYRFMESELDLNDIIQEMHVITTIPELYHLLVELNAVHSLLGLLSHENTDILANKVFSWLVSKSESKYLQVLTVLLNPEHISPSRWWTCSRSSQTSIHSTRARKEPRSSSTPWWGNQQPEWSFRAFCICLLVERRLLTGFGACSASISSVLLSVV